MAYTDKAYREWLTEAEALIRQTPVPADWDISAPLTLDVSFGVLKPKTSKLLYPKPDIDNYEKSFMDAVTQAGTLWADDCQVVQLNTLKTFVSEGEGITFKLTPYAIQ